MNTKSNPFFPYTFLSSFLSKCVVLTILMTLFFIQGVFAGTNIIGYRIFYSNWSTLDSAKIRKDKINQAIPDYVKYYYDTKGKAYIVDNQTTYSVYLGDFQKLGEARLVKWFMISKSLWGRIDPIPSPIPPVDSILGTPEEIYSQATSFMKEEDFPRARAYFEACVHNYPESDNYFQALMGLGLAESKLNNRLKAIQAFKKVAVSQNSLANEALLRMGYSYLAMYDLHNSYITFQSVIKKYPGTPQAKEAQERLNAFKGKNKQDTLYKNAMLLIAGQKYKNAIYVLDKFIKSYPKSPRVDEAYLRRANCKIKLNNKKGAFADYKQLLRFPKSKFAKDGCGELCKLAVYMDSTSYLWEAADAISKSPCLDTSNQELGAFYQTFRCDMLYSNIPSTPQGKLGAGPNADADGEAIKLCREVALRYPQGNRFDLARAKLIEVKLLMRLSDNNVVIQEANKLISDYPEQRKVLCNAYIIIAWAQGVIGELDNAFQTNQYVIDHFTVADNISIYDDVIALALWRQVGCLQSQKRNEEVRPLLQEIIRNHDQSYLYVHATNLLKQLDQK